MHQVKNILRLTSCLIIPELINEGVAYISPAAAIAAKLSKSGMSLTQVYTQLVNCEEELITTKEENKRLSSYIEQVCLQSHPIDDTASWQFLSLLLSSIVGLIIEPVHINSKNNANHQVVKLEAP